MVTAISKLPLYGVMGPFNPRQTIRNKFQPLMNLALYGVGPTARGMLPIKNEPLLIKLKTDSLFRRTYSGIESMPATLRGKVDKGFFALYQWSAASNVSQAMNAAYYWTMDMIENPKWKGMGWADPKRTHKEPKGFAYPSEEARILKEMEYGAHTTQFQYLGMAMPQIFRTKSLAWATRLTSWFMNYTFVFQREALTRVLTGHTGYSSELLIPMSQRMNYLKYLAIAGVVLNTLGYERSYMLGVAPTSWPPTAQFVFGLTKYVTHLGDSDWDERKRNEAAKDMAYAAKTFIPGYLSITDIGALLSGEKDWTEYLFYNKKGETVSSYDDI